MALEIAYSKLVHGQELIFPTAYLQIVKDYGDKVNRTACVVIYADSTKEEALINIDYTFEATTDENSPNFIKQGYEHLKTLPEYSFATDV